MTSLDNVIAQHEKKERLWVISTGPDNKGKHTWFSVDRKLAAKDNRYKHLIH